MKKIVVIFFTLMSVMAGVAQESAKPNIARLNTQMNKLWKQQQYLEAMDTAVYILSVDPSNRAATDFVYRNWDKMSHYATNRLQNLYDEESVSEGEERCEIYRLLDEINTHLSSVPMPLYGPGERWVWQPEISYYSGHYDTERMALVRLLMRKADEALKSHDTETAGQYYTLALQKYLLTEGERKVNREEMLRRLDRSLDGMQQTDRIHEAIFSYELMQLSLLLNSEQPEMEARKEQMQQYVADLYLEAANAALQAGDSITWQEYTLSYDDWKIIKPADEEN